MTTYGANFYLTFEANDAKHASTIASAIVCCHNKDGEAVVSPETLLPVSEPTEGEIATWNHCVRIP